MPKSDAFRFLQMHITRMKVRHVRGDYNTPSERRTSEAYINHLQLCLNALRPSSVAPMAQEADWQQLSVLLGGDE